MVHEAKELWAEIANSEFFELIDFLNNEVATIYDDMKETAQDMQLEIDYKNTVLVNLKEAANHAGGDRHTLRQLAGEISTINAEVSKLQGQVDKTKREIEKATDNLSNSAFLERKLGFFKELKQYQKYSSWSRRAEKQAEQTVQDFENGDIVQLTANRRIQESLGKLEYHGKREGTLRQWLINIENIRYARDLLRH